MFQETTLATPYCFRGNISFWAVIDIHVEGKKAVSAQKKGSYHIGVPLGGESQEFVGHGEVQTLD